MEIEVTRSAKADFHGWPTMEQLRSFVMAAHDFPDDAEVQINAGYDQRDGRWCIFTVVEK